MVMSLLLTVVWSVYTRTYIKTHECFTILEANFTKLFLITLISISLLMRRELQKDSGAHHEGRKWAGNTNKPNEKRGVVYIYIFVTLVGGPPGVIVCFHRLPQEGKVDGHAEGLEHSVLLASVLRGSTSVLQKFEKETISSLRETTRRTQGNLLEYVTTHIGHIEYSCTRASADNPMNENFWMDSDP